MAPPTSSDLGGKPGRRILIFDNHPDSLRLLSEHFPSPDVDVTPPLNTNASCVLGVALILTLVLGALWLIF
jgi:hypothetical protein